MSVSIEGTMRSPGWPYTNSVLRNAGDVVLVARDLLVGEDIGHGRLEVVAELLGSVEDGDAGVVGLVYC